MSLRWFYRPSWRSGDPAVEFTDSVRLYTLDVTEQAEEGAVATSNIIVDDPLAALDFPPLTRLWAKETEISASSNTYVYHGYIGSRRVRRGDSGLTGSSRVWSIEVTDENSVLSRRVFSQTNADRPAETDVARVLWLANEAEGQLLIDDTTFLSTASPVLMDAADYRGQTALQVLNDCAEASGKNFYAYFNENVGTGIWYGAQDLTTHNSMIRLSNDIADVDDLTTFFIGDQTELFRDPSRLISSVYYQYTGGAVYVRDQSMFDRIGLRDAPMSSLNVKTQARATARANRLLGQLDTEMDRITTTVYLPAAKVNWIKAGMRLQFKATHLPGYESFVWLRVLSRGVAFNSEQTDSASYLLTLELSTDSIPADPVPATFPASAILYQPKNNGGGGIHPDIRWGSSGDDPAGGFPEVPLVGSLEYVTDSLLPGVPYKGFRALGSGSLTVTYNASDVAAVVNNVTCTPSILKNGVVVASDPHTSLGGAFPYGHSYSWEFSTTISVVSGDVISTQMSSSWGDTMTVPSGSGQDSHKLSVSGALT